MIDCLTVDEKYPAYIERCYKELGLDITQLKAILITHGHGDHYGRADFLRVKYGTKIYMSEADYNYAHDANDPNSVFPDGPLVWNVDGYLAGGNTFKLGNTEFVIAATPGHGGAPLPCLAPISLRC